MLLLQLQFTLHFCFTEIPTFCCVIICGSVATRDKVSFDRIPAEFHYKHKTALNKMSAERRQRWINAIKRDDLTEKS